MKISVVTPNFNGATFLDQAIASVVSQRETGVELEYIVVDGGSSDRSLEIVNRHGSRVSLVISEKDKGPANALNKGFGKATGDIFAWINSDDFYYPGALKRAADALARHPQKSLCFGHCPIVNEKGEEIRVGITRFKEMFFPISSRFALQCVNYISQPSVFFRRAAWEKAGALREDLTAAWDYDLITRLWRHGGGVEVANPPLAAFRWREKSISGLNFRRQFKEEWDVAARDAGRLSLQALLHLCVRWGIVWSYDAMARRRRRTNGESL